MALGVSTIFTLDLESHYSPHYLVSTPAAETEGAKWQDFSLLGNSCGADVSFNFGAIFVELISPPKAAGMRMGAITIDTPYQTAV
jgi:hypothetical protein